MPTAAVSGRRQITLGAGMPDSPRSHGQHTVVAVGLTRVTCGLWAGRPSRTARQARAPPGNPAPSQRASPDPAFPRGGLLVQSRALGPGTGWRVWRGRWCLGAGPDPARAAQREKYTHRRPCGRVSFSGVSRQFLVAALAHLAVVGAVLLLGPGVGPFTVRWEFLLWLLLIGFIGFSTAGFALHLFPTIARRPQPPVWLGQAAFVLAEGGLVLGAAPLSASLAFPWPGGVFALGAGLFLAGECAVVALLVGELRRPRLTSPGASVRPGDSATVPLFLASWSFALASGALFVASGLAVGPGFGWWLAAVHLFVLGHVVLLITAVTLRLMPRSLATDVSRRTVGLLVGFSVSGAIGVPIGMLVSSPASPTWLALFAAPEAVFAALLFSVLVALVHRARTPPASLMLRVASLLLFLVGGSIGLWMVAEANYTPVAAHALVGLLGFVGLTILAVWFGLIAPFQRVSHTWTGRMIWILSGAWLAAMATLALLGAEGGAGPGGSLGLAGGLLLASDVAWAVGTIPVLWPELNPLPGVRSERLREFQKRWRQS